MKATLMPDVQQTTEGTFESAIFPPASGLHFPVLDSSGVKLSVGRRLAVHVAHQLAGGRSALCDITKALLSSQSCFRTSFL